MREKSRRTPSSSAASCSLWKADAGTHSRIVWCHVQRHDSLNSVLNDPAYRLANVRVPVTHAHIDAIRICIKEQGAGGWEEACVQLHVFHSRYRISHMAITIQQIGESSSLGARHFQQG